jgi:coenzyme F420-dependent glucose-6-phosphate dehydrogenase
MPRTRYYMALAHEQFPPGELLRQATAAEEAGFDGVCCSDHLQPWWVPGESGHAWVWLGAAGAVTRQVAIGSAVTAPMYRHHPVMVAQAFATLEAMFPGRAFLGVGSGESLNESPTGVDWPSPREQLERMDEALWLIDRLLDGERVSHEGRHFRTKGAYLHTRGRRRPPVYVSAFYPGAARVAGRRGDGLWTLANPETAPGLIEAYRSAAEDAGRGPGQVLLQVGVSWARTDEAAMEGARLWKGAQLPEFFTGDWHDPEAMQRRAEERVSDEALREALVISSDPDDHVARIRRVEELGATIVVVMNNSGADPMGAIRTYRDRVLPTLRAGRAQRARADSPPSG